MELTSNLLPKCFISIIPKHPNRRWITVVSKLHLIFPVNYCEPIYLVSLVAKTLTKFELESRNNCVTWNWFQIKYQNCLNDDDDDDGDSFIRPLIEKSETNFTAEKNLTKEHRQWAISNEHLMDGSSAGCFNFFQFIFDLLFVRNLVWPFSVQRLSTIPNSTVECQQSVNLKFKSFIENFQ